MRELFLVQTSDIICIIVCGLTYVCYTGQNLTILPLVLSAQCISLTRISKIKGNLVSLKMEISKKKPIFAVLCIGDVYRNPSTLQ